LFLLLAPLIGWLARRKGYSFWRWALSGDYGFIYLAFLPSVKKGATIDEMETIRENGNKRGGWVTAFNIFMSIISLIFGKSHM